MDGEIDGRKGRGRLRRIKRVIMKLKNKVRKNLNKRRTKEGQIKKQRERADKW